MIFVEKLFIIHSNIKKCSNHSRNDFILEFFRRKEETESWNKKAVLVYQ